MTWRIYYDDGAVFSDADGTPWQAPRLGVQVIVQSDERVGWRWVSGGDYFYFEPGKGGWRTTETFGMYDHLMHAAQPLVLFGRHLSDAAWHELFARVKAELGPKQGWLVTEDRREGAQ